MERQQPKRVMIGRKHPSYKCMNVAAAEGGESLKNSWALS